MSCRGRGSCTGADQGAGHSWAQDIVPQRVHRGRLVDVRLHDRLLHRTLQALLGQVVAALHLRARIHRQLGRRKHPVPGPQVTRLGVLALQRKRHVHPGHARRPVLRPQRARLLELRAQRLHQRLRQHHHPVFAALAIAHDNHAAIELHILDAQAQTLEQAHARAVEQARQQPHLALQLRQQRRHLRHAQHHGHAARARGTV